MYNDNNSPENSMHLTPRPPTTGGGSTQGWGGTFWKHCSGAMYLMFYVCVCLQEGYSIKDYLLCFMSTSAKGLPNQFGFERSRRCHRGSHSLLYSSSINVNSIRSDSFVEPFQLGLATLPPRKMSSSSYSASPPPTMIAIMWPHQEKWKYNT